MYGALEAGGTRYRLIWASWWWIICSLPARVPRSAIGYIGTAGGSLESGIASGPLTIIAGGYGMCMSHINRFPRLANHYM